MKILILSAAISLAFLGACNSNTSKTSATANDPLKTSAGSGAEQKATNPVSVSGIVDSYLQLKDALTKDNNKDAAAAGAKMVTAFASFDKSSLSSKQGKEYADIEGDAKEHAEHIGANAGNIKHQREHFAMLSKDIYDLVKLIGAGQSLYLDHCPMYDNKKGADWLSETKEIKNPYLGKAMPGCGTVKEELKM